MDFDPDSARRRQRQVRRAVRLMGLSGLALCAGLAAPDAAMAQKRQLVRGFNIELQGRVQYDSNVARASKTAATAENVQPNDLRYSVSAAIDGGRRIGRQTATVSGSVSYDFYGKNKSLDRWRADVGAGLAGRVGPCSAAANVNYVRSLAELSPILITDPRNSVESTIGYGASTTCPLASSIGVSGSIQQRRIEPSGARSQISSVSTSASAGLSYASQSIGAIGITGSYATASYGKPPIPLPFPSGGFDNYSVGIQYSRPLGNRLSGAANLNYNWVVRSGVSAATKALTGGNTSGLRWDARLTYNASEKLTTTLSYSDSTTATARIGSAYQRQRRVSAGANYKINDDLSASLRAGRSFRSFSGTVGPQLGLAQKETRTSYSASLDYSLGRNIRLSLDGGLSKLDTDQPLLNYTSERASFTVAAKF